MEYYWPRVEPITAVQWDDTAPIEIAAFLPRERIKDMALQQGLSMRWTLVLWVDGEDEDTGLEERTVTNGAWVVLTPQGRVHVLDEETFHQRYTDQPQQTTPGPNRAVNSVSGTIAPGASIVQCHTYGSSTLHL